MNDQDQTPDSALMEEERDDVYHLDRQSVARILLAVDNDDRAALVGELEPLHAADIADLLEQIDPFDRRRLIALYGAEFDGEILSELQDSIREEVLRYLSPEVLAEAVRGLDSDDVVDLIEDLEDHEQDAILEVLEDSDRIAVRQSLTYPEYSAGRLMQREFVMAPEYWTVGEAIDFMRRQPELPEQFYHIILVDPKLHPIGNVTLGKLMSARRDVMLSALVEDTFHVIPVDQDEGDVAYAFNQYHLISAPVVDENDRLVGVITIDDAMVVLDEEHEEDILRLAGVNEESSLSDSVAATSRRRLPWLMVSLVTANMSAFVISQFEETILQFVALAVLMPIVASMGGNAGTQVLTVTVRALSARDLTASNAWRVVRREIMVGLINGGFFALVMGIMGYVWFGSPVLGYVIAAAMTINMTIAGMAGTLVPLALDRFGVDPALASGTFVTTMTDVFGFLAFLGLATVFLL
ncbi:MAG: magnesium transporter [Rhodobacterales bacterium]|nr:magnesium transporter [Rhodobacterales bacterium]